MSPSRLQLRSAESITTRTLTSSQVNTFRFSANISEAPDHVGGAGGGKGLLHPLAVTRPIDIHSPTLFRQTVTGQHLQTMSLITIQPDICTCFSADGPPLLPSQLPVTISDIPLA